MDFAKSSAIKTNSMLKMDNFLIAFAKVAKKENKIESIIAPKRTLFKKNKPQLNSGIELSEALEKASEIYKHIDLLGENKVEDIYEPMHLLSGLSDAFKKLPCTMDENFLTVDFKDTKDSNGEAVGVRSFKLVTPSKEQKDNDMIRRSKD